MVKYRNPRHEEEMREVEQIEEQENFMREPATSSEEEVWKKRYGDLRRHLDSVQNDNKNRITELENKLEQALRGKLKAPSTDEEIEQWMAEYPEFARILETLLQSRIREATSKTEEKLSRVELKQRELDAREAFLELRKRHPDIDQILAKDSDFRKWLEKQPERYKEKMNGLDVDEASLVISKFKSEFGKSKSKSKVDEDDDFGFNAAKVVRNKSVVEEPDADAGDYEFTESQIDKMGRADRSWYEKNEDKIMEAARRGKILYDLSGGAR